MEYFYAPPQDIHGTSIVLGGEEFRHLVKVLRKKKGETVLVANGEGMMYETVLTSIDRDRAVCDIVRTADVVPEPAVEITLAVSLLKNPARFDFLVEKGTELGVRRFLPMTCERTIARSEKTDRLEKLCVAAMKQSGRSYKPRVLPLTSFEEVVRGGDAYALRLIAHEKTDRSRSLSGVIRSEGITSPVLILIGPEGGFSDGEMEQAADRNFLPVSLGPRRLRAETAALLALALTVGES